MERDVPLSTSLPLESGATPFARRTAARTRAAIGTIDRLLRERQHVYEYSFAADCVLRIALREARTSRTLHDGTSVRPGDRLIELHLWNEHLHLLNDKEPGLGRILRFRRQLICSLSELATLVDVSPEVSESVALCARLTLRGRPDKIARVAAEFGFEIFLPRKTAGLVGVLLRNVETIWFVALAWAYNPRSLNRHWSERYRAELWISRAALIRHYGPQPSARYR